MNLHNTVVLRNLHLSYIISSSSRFAIYRIYDITLKAADFQRNTFEFHKNSKLHYEVLQTVDLQMNTILQLLLN